MLKGVLQICGYAQSCLTLCDSTDCSLQGPLSMGFPRQEYWSGLPFPPLGDLPNPGMEPMSRVSCTGSRALPLCHLGSPSSSEGRKSTGRTQANLGKYKKLLPFSFIQFFFFACLFWFWGTVPFGWWDQPGIEPRSLAVKAQSPNHWATREFPHFPCLKAHVTV